LDAWYRTTKSARWVDLAEIRKTYSSVDGVPFGGRVYTVFNICGNRFRLIVEINYRTKRVFIRHVLTHAEYDREGWKK